MVQPGLSHSNSASVWRCGALHIPQSSGTLAQAGLPLSAPQPVDLGEFFALIRPPFKQVKQKQHLNRPGSLHQRFICKLLPFCSWSDGKCWVRWSLYHFLICTLTAKKKSTKKIYSLPAFVKFLIKLPNRRCRFCSVLLYEGKVGQLISGLSFFFFLELLFSF